MLTGRLEEALEAQEKSQASAKELKATIAKLKLDEEALRAEVATAAHQAEKAQKRLEQEEQLGRDRSSELEEMRAALAARNGELQQSREAADEFDRRLSDKLVQVETLDGRGWRRPKSC